MKKKNTSKDNFKKWFGNSKVVDDKGKPLVVYHGTLANYEFKIQESSFRYNGFYASKNLKYAEKYAEDRGSIMPIYIKIENPYIFNMRNTNSDIMGTIVIDDRMIVSYRDMTKDDILFLKSKGYDGIIVNVPKFIAEDGSKFEVVAFNPTQIKSATGNNGDFNPNNPNILMGIGEVKQRKLSQKELDFVRNIEAEIIAKKKHNKTSIEKIALNFGITDKNIVKELTELAIVNLGRIFAHYKEKNTLGRYERIVELYNNQVNLSQRTSTSVMLQQYSTPAPIGYLAGIYCGIEKFNENQLLFEPSAGNGLLTIAGTPQKTHANEIDEIRFANLQTQNFYKLTNIDASIPFPKEWHKKYDAVITNPPFGAIEPIMFGTFPIKSLEMVMCLYALQCMKDEGKCAIIIGGHTKWDDKGRIQAGKNRIFFNYLYKHYNVEDVININGKKLYSRQGTGVDVRMILINGRKSTPEGFAPIKTDQDKVVDTFEELYNRVVGNEENVLSAELTEDEIFNKQKEKHIYFLMNKLKEYYIKNPNIRGLVSFLRGSEVTDFWGLCYDLVKESERKFIFEKGKGSKGYNIWIGNEFAKYIHKLSGSRKRSGEWDYELINKYLKTLLSPKLLLLEIKYFKINYNNKYVIKKTWINSKTGKTEGGYFYFYSDDKFEMFKFYKNLGNQSNFKSIEAAKEKIKLFNIKNAEIIKII